MFWCHHRLPLPTPGFKNKKTHKMPLWNAHFIGSRLYRLNHPKEKMERGLKLARRLVPLQEDDHVKILPEGVRPEWEVPPGAKVVGVVTVGTGKTRYIQVTRAQVDKLETYMHELIELKIFVQVAPGGAATKAFTATVPRKHLSLSYNAAVESLYTTMTSRTEFHKTKRADGRIASLRELAFDATLTHAAQTVRRGARKVGTSCSSMFTDESSLETVQSLFQVHGGVVGELLAVDAKLRAIMAHHIVKWFFDIHHTVGRILFAFAMQACWTNQLKQKQDDLDDRCTMFGFLEAASTFDYLRHNYERTRDASTVQFLDVAATILKIRADAIRDGGDAKQRMLAVFPQVEDGDSMLLQLGKNPDGLYFSEHRSYMLKHHGPITATLWAFPNFVQCIMKALRTGPRYKSHGSMALQLSENARAGRKKRRREAAEHPGDGTTYQEKQRKDGAHISSSHSSDESEAEPARG